MLKLSSIVLVLTVTAACGSQPTAEIDAARAARDKASAANASRYAPESLAAAESAQKALDAELAAQDAKWMKSYDRARELATTARSASEKAAVDAVAGKERADAAARAAEVRAKNEAEARAKLATTAVRVGGPVRNPTKIKDVKPEYPAVAKSARIGGTVQVAADRRSRRQSGGCPGGEIGAGPGSGGTRCREAVGVHAHARQRRRGAGHPQRGDQLPAVGLLASSPARGVAPGRFVPGRSTTVCQERRGGRQGSAGTVTLQGLGEYASAAGAVAVSLLQRAADKAVLRGPRRRVTVLEAVTAVDRFLLRASRPVQYTVIAATVLHMVAVAIPNVPRAYIDYARVPLLSGVPQYEIYGTRHDRQFVRRQGRVERSARHVHQGAS